MKYVVTHTTSYQYSSPVSVCHNVLMLEPRIGASLTCENYRLTVFPEPKVAARRTDMFGNFVRRFSLEENHKQLTITSQSHVTVLPPKIAESSDSPLCGQVTEDLALLRDPNWLAVVPFLQESPRINRSKDFASYAEGCLAKNRPIVEAATELTQKIFHDFKYDKDATLVDTPAETAFAGRHGVCQDFAHIAVACFRSNGLAARYVSGYLRTLPAAGKKRLVGADESHAWLSVYCGHQLGWVDFDPTNNCLCNTDHVPIAVGRDYSDVVPVKGIFLGGGQPQMSISVDVAPNTPGS